MFTVLVTVLVALLAYLVWYFYDDRIKVYAPRAVTLFNVGTTKNRRMIWHNLKAFCKTISFAVIALAVIAFQIVFTIVIYPLMVLYIFIKTVITKPVDSKG